MRMATLCALAIGVCLAAAQTQQDSAPKKSDATASPAKPDAPPGGTPAPAAASATSPAATPASSDTDPLKMAAPQSDGTAKPDANAPVSEKTYVIGAQDLLNISVWNSPPLTGGHTVRPDGRITIPLIGEVEAAGKTPMQLEQEIADKLKNGHIILNPSVAVSVTQVNSKKYYLEGEVNKPGEYSLIVPRTVLEALVEAGGFRDFAKETRIRIIRGKQTFMFNYKQVIKNQKTDQNIYLQPGDIIVVP